MYYGNFYVDDVNLEIQTKDQKWKSIFRTGFEKGLDDWKQGIGNENSGVNFLYKGQLTNEKPKSGNKCFLVHGKGIPNYGTNSKVGKYAEVNGIKLYYEVYGEGHPLVVLHGNGGSSKDAAPHYPELIKKPDSTAVFSWAIDHDLKTIKESSDLKEKKLLQLMLDHPNVPFSGLSKIKIPVLVMAGDRDVIRPEHTLKLFQNIPKSQLCILPGTTHGASWEKKDLFLELLYDFSDKSFTMPTTQDWYK